ncbi:nuclear transport factor 2 family protein [Rufibacter psychrotolerans]|uniref:nuclear transport factor 2 family protein n=1 Tax=Rufibacter psychrotolerans TaxID=2812556 RepID=UPI0019677FA6|nr:nuclear transport factor 2 family protein [Rufibacter sp. SYSU D00308]
MKAREEIIHRYVAAYNAFQVDGMLADLDENIRFENITNGVTNLSLQGLAAFREQAEQAKSLFSARTQTIQSFLHREQETEVEIAYHAVLAQDLPNGLKTGHELHLRGKSIFRFSGDKITQITDIS